MIRWSTSVALGVSAGIAACIAFYWYYRRRSSEMQRSGSSGVPNGRLVHSHSNYTTEIAVPDEVVGYIIGKEGQNVKQLRSQMGVKITFKEIEGGSRVAVICGKRDSVDQARSTIQRQITEKLTVKKIDTFAFQVPQYTVGRIIGKQGKTIRELCRVSGAKIEIERGSEYNLLCQRRCTITGTAEQINRAKLLLEEKVVEENEFRRKRGSDQSKKNMKGASLMQKDREMSVFAAQAATVDLGALSPRLPAVTDYFTVYVAAVEHPGHFWIQVLEPDGTKLDAISQEINSIYPHLEASEMALKHVSVGDIVCALFEHDSSWYRARVEDIISDSEVEVYFVDFGDNSRVPYSSIKRIRPEFLQLPFQAIECGLHGICPKAGESAEWSDDAVDLFEETTHCARWRPLMAKIMGYELLQSTKDNVPMLELVDTNSREDINIAGELVREGFAIWSSDKQIERSLPAKGAEPDLIADSLTKDT